MPSVKHVSFPKGSLNVTVKCECGRTSRLNVSINQDAATAEAHSAPAPQPGIELFEEKLSRIGAAYRRGLMQDPPVREDHLAAVRRAAKKKWEQDQRHDQSH